MPKKTNENWPPKAYKNIEFLNSPEARKIRILCELEETERRFREENIEDTIVMFGSARTIPVRRAKKELRELEKSLTGKRRLSAKDKRDLVAAKAKVMNAPYYDAAMALSRELTAWSMSLPEKKKRFIVCSGGGPGIMEAANRGAKKAGGASIGLGISLPFEQGLNPYITHDLKFEYHYFFVRKYWFLYFAKALIAFPGGFGTMDELFETLTLIQTHKLQKKVPIILYGSEFWNALINWDAFLEWGVISPDDLKLFKIVNSVDEAKDYVVKFLTKTYLKG